MPNLLDMLNALGEPEKPEEDLAHAPSPTRDPFRENPHLAMMLMMAVPLWIERVRGLDWPERARRAHQHSALIAYKGDILMFGGGKKGEVAEVFNATAEAIAILSFVPGGVTIFGMKFVTEDHDERSPSL